MSANTITNTAELTKEEKYQYCMKFLKSLRFVNDCDEENRETRLKGKPKSLVGRIYKDYKDSYSPFGNLLKPFKIPTDWPVVAMIDWHPSTKQAISFMCVDDLNRDYTIDEVWENMGDEDIADEIIRRKISGWRITDAYIDKLSKGSSKATQNKWGEEQNSYNIIKERLSNNGITLHEQSRSKDSGILTIKTKLSAPNKIPCFFVFDTCARHRWEVKRYIYTDGAYPDKDDHFMQNWYAYALIGLKYTPLKPKRKKYEYVAAGVA